MTVEAKSQVVGYGKYVYRHVPGWGNLPDGWEWNHAVGVGVDAQDRVFVYNRSDHPMIVLDTDGNVLDSWGEGQFGSAHHLEIGPDGSLYTTDIGNHNRSQVDAGRPASDDAWRPRESARKDERRPVQRSYRRGNRLGRYNLCLGRIRQREDSPLQRRPVSISDPGANPEAAPVNSGFRTALRRATPATFTSPIAKTAASRYLHQTVST